MQNDSLISVIIPVYNTEKHLQVCLNSIINQTYNNLEIIIVNDGSKDNSIGIIQEYAAKDSRIHIIDKENGGLSSARNAGLKVATGKYVLHVDSDDWIELTMCEKLVDVAEKGNADIVISDVYFELDKNVFIRTEPYSSIESSETFLKKYVLHAGLNSVWNKLFSLSLYKKNNLLHYEDISLGEDSSCLLRLIANAKKISYVNQPFYHYNMKSSGMSRGIKKGIMQYYTGIKRVELYYKDINKDIKIFPLIRFKVVYAELIRCSLRKAYKFEYSDYSKVAKLFIDDLKNIKSYEGYRDFKFKYKFFINLYKVYYFLTPAKYR